MVKGTSLFGWCLPDAPIDVHARCIEAFDFNGAISCSCLCHTDNALFIKQMTRVSKPAKKTKGAKK